MPQISISAMNATIAELLDESEVDDYMTDNSDAQSRFFAYAKEHIRPQYAQYVRHLVQFEQFRMTAYLVGVGLLAGPLD